MGLFDQFPYTNFHELNLDWILQALKELEHTIEQFVSINALKYADPIQWDITTQYEKNTIVVNPQSGTAYISVDAVPSGVSLDNTDYWTPVFNVDAFVVGAVKNLANIYEESTTLTATISSNAGDWIIWGDSLYKTLVNITAGDSYVIGSNIEALTIEDAINDLYNAIIAEQASRINGDNNIIAMIGVLSNLSTSAKNNLVAAINELYNAIIAEQASRINGDNNIIAMIGTLSNLHTVDKSSIVAAINEVHDAAVVNRRIITVADSYGYHPDASSSWQALLANIYSDATFYNYYEGSMGIYHQGSSGHRVQELLAYYAPIIPDHDSITDIVIALGINDYQDNISDVATAYDNLITYCKTTFPNAKLYFGFAGYTHRLVNAALVANYKNLISLMMSKSAESESSYISNIEYIMHDLTNNESDLVHPNSRGASCIADAVSMALAGSVYHYRNTQRTDVTSGSGATVANAMVQTIDDGITTIKCENVYNSSALSFTGADFIQFATIADPLVYNSNCQLYTSIFSNDASAPPAMTAITSGGNILLSYTGSGTRTVNGVQLNRFNMSGNTLDM